ncbi:MAG: CoA-acylating methylmalonate-semialdehyde dehydrogenase, partial [Sciscionella sp.]
MIDPIPVTHWIGGKPFDGQAERNGPVFNPATGAVTGIVNFAGPEEVRQAVAAAGEAFSDWGAATVARRARVLFAFRELLNQRKDELAEIITAEHGKVTSDAAGEVARGLENVEFACNIGHALKGDFTANAATAVDVHSMRQPLGVVGIVSPFNFPAMVPLWFAPLAIACGNTVVLKPSEKDPSAANWLAQRWADAGLPDGVFNVVHGDKQAVDGLLAHPDVAAVSFVGSTPIARYVYEIASSHGKRVQALGGAKNHMVVLPDADLDAAADAAVSAGFGSAGERCMAVSVVVAAESVAEDLVARIRDRIQNLCVGDGRHSSSEMGPLVTAAHRDRVAAYVERGVVEGATLVTDGRNTTVDGDPGGFWLGPTLFDHVRTDMAIYTDEIFGPVLSVVRVPGLVEATRLVNANPYG